MTTDNIIIATATLLGPIVSVSLAIWLQSRMQKQQNDWQAALLKKLEDERREWEFKREDSRAKYEDAWNLANRDRANRMAGALDRIADASEKKG